jgi:hypothetical protein
MCRIGVKKIFSPPSVLCMATSRGQALVTTKLAKADYPTFCFVITMEAHGPWLHGRNSSRGKSPEIIENSIRKTASQNTLGTMNFNKISILSKIRSLKISVRKFWLFQLFQHVYTP